MDLLEVKGFDGDISYEFKYKYDSPFSRRRKGKLIPGKDDKDSFVYIDKDFKSGGKLLKDVAEVLAL